MGKDAGTIPDEVRTLLTQIAGQLGSPATVILLANSSQASRNRGFASSARPSCPAFDRTTHGGNSPTVSNATRTPKARVFRGSIAPGRLGQRPSNDPGTGSCTHRCAMG